MEQGSYYLVLKYLREHSRPVTPAELSAVLQKSRVTIQSSLKRLVTNGWVTKQGSSPHTFYAAVEVQAMPKTESKRDVTMEELRNICKIGLIEDFVLKSNRIRK